VSVWLFSGVQGHGIPRDLIGAAYYFRLAADRNDAQAQFIYGCFLCLGYGVPIDLIAAAQYFKLAADQNLARAQSVYGLYLESGETGREDRRAAIVQYERAAELGDWVGLQRLGHCLEFGSGTAKNRQRAAECYRMSASRGDPASQFAFGFCLEHGLGVPKDHAKSLTYYREAARAKDAEGCFHCGLLLQFGIATDVDLDEAASFYELVPTAPIMEEPSFRCRRSLSKARPVKVKVPTPKQPQREVSLLDEFKSRRSLTAPRTIDNYLTSPVGDGCGRVIGESASSTVRERVDPDTGVLLAVKTISATVDRHRFFREVENLVDLNHPCVVRIHKWTYPRGMNGAEIHMEFATNGSLEAVLKKLNSGRTPAFWCRTGIGILICGIVLGMRYVHSRGIIHRDLKPSNILVNSKGHAWIADFGVSWLVDDVATSSGGTGTPCYAAPELYRDDVDCTPKCDVFSFGLVLYEILTMRAVFDPSELGFPIIRRLRARDLPKIPSEHGAFMQRLITKCWENDPQDRPSFQEMFTWFQAAKFAILPSADAIEIGEFCAAVIEWEKEAGIRL
jgi:hypothetical protein